MTGGSSRIEGHIRLSDTRPFRTEPRDFLPAKRRCSTASWASRTQTVWSSPSPLPRDTAPDVQAFAKNYMAVGFKLDYVKADGELSTYTPDFIVRTTDGTVWIVETKGREELDRAAEDGAAAPMVRRRDRGQRSGRWDALRLRLRRSRGFETAQAVVVRRAGERFPRIPGRR